MRVALLAPIKSSRYSKLVASFVDYERGIELVGVVVRSPFSIKRIHHEFQRDGVRLLEKVLNKIVLNEDDKLKKSHPRIRKLVRQANRNTLQSFCRDRHVPYLVTSDHNSKQSMEFLKQLKPDVIAFTGGGLIRKEVLAIPTIGTLNCHSGILPHCRGMDVVEWPVVEGRTVLTGLTVHFMDQGVDTGPILAHYYLRFMPGVTFIQFRQELELQMPILMLETLRELRDGTARETVQKPEEGRQYYIMHPRMKAYAEKCVKYLTWPKASKPKFVNYPQ